MQTQITTRHGSLSDVSREKIADKTDKLKRYFDRLSSIEVIVDLKDETSPRVDLKVSAEHKHDFLAHAEEKDLWVSLDSALQKVEHQLRKYKEKVQSRHRNPELRRQEQIVDSEVETE